MINYDNYPIIANGYFLHETGDGSDLFFLSPSGCQSIAKFNYVKTDVLKKFNGLNTLDAIFNNIADEYKTSITNEAVKHAFNSFCDWLLERGIIKFLQTPVKKHISRISGQRGTSFPFLLSIEVTNKCSLKCPHCYADANTLSKSHNLHYDECINIMDFFANKTPYLNITGGEAMLHPRIMDILHKASASFKTSLLSNGYAIGSLSENELKQLPYIQLTMYGISKEAYKQNVGNALGYEDFVSAVTGLVKINADFIVVVILTKEFMKNLNETLLFLISLGVKNVKFSMATNFGRQVSNINKNDWTFTLEEKISMAKELECLKKTLSNKIIMFIFTEEDMLNFNAYDNKEKSFCDLNCFAGRSFLTMSEKGLFRPCSFLPSDIFNLGNLDTCLKTILEDGNFDLSLMLNKYEKFLTSQGLTFRDIECAGFR